MPKYRVTHTWDVIAADPDSALDNLDLNYNGDPDVVKPKSLAVNEWIDGWSILRDGSEPF